MSVAIYFIALMASHGKIDKSEATDISVHQDDGSLWVLRVP